MSTLIVENLKGPTTGSNANTITIPMVRRLVRQAMLFKSNKLL